MAITIEKKLIDAGYRMLGNDGTIEKLIRDILKTKNIRYLKAIPFLIYKYDLNITSMGKKMADLELFNTILDITEKIFIESNIKKKIPLHIRGNSKLEEKYAHKFASYYQEFKDEFELQLRNNHKPNLLIDRQRIDEERNLQYSLSQLFTKKEKQIIRRLQGGKLISRTDYEYFSRKTRKKLRSIINLQDFAKGIYAKTPKYDEELFELKRLLEDWILKMKEKGSIEEFHIFEKSIIMSLREKSGETSISSWRLTKIKDKRILHLLKIFPEYDFK